MKIIEKKVATNSSRDAEKLFQNEGHDVYNTFSERRAPPGGEKGNTAAWARTLWGAGRTPDSQKSRAFVWECCIFLQTLFSRAVRKGARGKVNLTP